MCPNNQGSVTAMAQPPSGTYMMHRGGIRSAEALLALYPHSTAVCTQHAHHTWDRKDMVGPQRLTHF